MKNTVSLYCTQLDVLYSEISLYKTEDNIWKLTGDITNSPGTLCLHICGNLNHFIGSLIGNSGYIRDREKEFADRNVSRKDLLELIEQTKRNISEILGKLNDDDFHKIYPENKFGENPSYAFIFSRLISHLSYHLGQINYHRRILDN